MPMRDKPTWWTYAAVFLSSLVMSGAALAVSVMYADANARKWCDIVVTMDDAYKQPRPPGSPPITPTGQKIASDMHQLRQQIGCK